MMKPKVVIVGAGFGGQGASHALLSLGVHNVAEVTVIDSRDTLSPAATWQYYLTGRAPEPLVIPLDRSLAGVLSGSNLKLNTTVSAVHPAQDCLELTDDSTVAYDYLILAPGATPDATTLPGLQECALDVTSSSDVHRIKQQLDGIAHGSTILIMVCKTPYKCPPFPFELAFLIDALLTERELRESCRIVISCPLEWPFGGSEALKVFEGAMEQKSVEYIGNALPSSLSRCPDGRVTVSYQQTDPIVADLCLSVFPHGAPDFIPRAMINAKGSVPVDIRTNRITQGNEGKTNIFCVGDACMMECPAKPGATIPKVSWS